MEYTKESERSKRSEGSGVKTISRGSSLFSFVHFLTLRKVSSQEQTSAVYEKHCDVFICGKLLRYESIVLSADKLIMVLKIRVAVAVFRSLFLQ